MADKTYDAVIIGGGSRGLALGMYLAKYGGMKVAIFDAHYELGGGWAYEEAVAGFASSVHAALIGDWYFLPLEWDFPEWREMVKWIHNLACQGAVFSEDQSCVLFYSSRSDPDQEKTWQELARFSEKDADTWVDYWRKWQKLKPIWLSTLFNPPLPPGVTGPLEAALADPESGFDPSWVMQTPLGVVRDMFESEAIQAALLRVVEMSSGYPPDTFGGGANQFLTQFTMADVGQIEHGTHNVAHAAYKIFLENGGETFTNREVEKVIIKNGKARGIRLTDGSEIEARKLVVSTLSPQQLVFQLTGEEYFTPRTVRRIKNLSIRSTCIAWYWWDDTGEWEFMYIWAVGSVVLLIAALMVAVSERQEWGPRVRRAIPRNPLGRLIAFLFYSGAAGGILWCVILMGLSLLIVYGATPASARIHFSWDGDEVIYLGLAQYAVAYTLTGLLLWRVLLARRMKHTFIWVVVLLLVAVGMVGPILGTFLLRSGWDGDMSVDNNFLMVTNPVTMGENPESRDVCLMFSGIWAVAAAVMSLPWTIEQFGKFKSLKPARAKRRRPASDG